MKTDADNPRADIDHDENGNLQLYMREIGRTPLLTISEEAAVAHRVRRGDQAARDLMIRANLRLVVKIAMEYRERGLPLADLISEGNLGLIKAVERYDPAQGKVSSYAGWWIRYAVKRALANQGKTIRIPVHLLGKIANMRRTALSLAQELGREPSDEEIAAELHVTTATVALWKCVSARPASLDARTGEGNDGATLGEIVADWQAANAFEFLRDHESGRDLHTMIATLDSREATIIRLRFGLGTDEPHTLEQIAQRFGITRERIRQLESLALRKLRSAVRRYDEPRADNHADTQERRRGHVAGPNVHRSLRVRAHGLYRTCAVEQPLPPTNTFVGPAGPPTTIAQNTKRAAA